MRRPKLLGSVFCYEQIPGAKTLQNRLSKLCDRIVIADSDSPSRGGEEFGIQLGENGFYTGLFNATHSLAKGFLSDWVLIVTGDVEIDADALGGIYRIVPQVMTDPTIGVWSPSANGRVSPECANCGTGDMRDSFYCEGFFSLIRRSVLDRLCPVDPEVNLYGTGIDVGTSAYAFDMGLRSVIDDRVEIHHPGGKGYPKRPAIEQRFDWYSRDPVIARYARLFHGSRIFLSRRHGQGDGRGKRQNLKFMRKCTIPTPGPSGA